MRTDATQLLEAVEHGESGAAAQLLPLVYDELRRLAADRLQAERANHTLQATALVHEAFLRLVDQTRVAWRSRAHFFAIAAQAIRRVLIDHARGQKRQKRGGGAAPVALHESLVGADADLDLLALDDALALLAEAHPEKAHVVELRFFGGLTNDEAAEVLGVNARTIERHWQFARAWLFRKMMST